MKSSLKLFTMGVFASSLFLAACSTPPQPVTRDQYQSATQEAFEAEQTAAKSLQERDQLKSEVSRKETELKSLKEYERVLGY
jgi:hypothetical protein